jgi:signal transduction histidine kinase
METKFLIRVRDTRPGVNYKQMAHVFERFYQVEREGKIGSGLGFQSPRNWPMQCMVGLKLPAHSARGLQPT